jgi:metallo-beta-lactamase family protein
MPEDVVTHRPELPLLRFLGACGTVTGSRFLLDLPQARVLIDCGLFQGVKKLRLRNWEPFPVDPASLDAVLLTHAHVDHSGYLPALERHGFRGAVWSTAGTAELCEIMLVDSARIQEEDASYANRKGYSKHSPALPLYDRNDAENVLERFRTVPWASPVEVAKGVRATFRRAGHILGSATIEIELLGAAPRRIVFSGDLGRQHHPILLPPDPLPEADQVLVESTYGDRDQDEEDVLEKLAAVITRTADRGGCSVVPAFAVDRTEVVLLHLKRLVEAGRIPSIPVFVDSPMALSALGVYRRALAEEWSEIRPELRGQPSPFDPGTLREARSVEESKALAEHEDPAIIIAAAGMATGGRVLHHLRQRLPDARNSVLLVGYQAVATRGRRLLEGETTLKLLGGYVPVRAEVVDLARFSVHADRRELLSWLRTCPRPPETTFVVHGDADASKALCGSIRKDLDWNAVVPRSGEVVRLDPLPARRLR